jgi:hypothetical protein
MRQRCLCGGLNISEDHYWHNAENFGNTAPVVVSAVLNHMTTGLARVPLSMRSFQTMGQGSLRPNMIVQVEESL